MKEWIPCRPTISATCSLLGTGTHSVVFCDFLFLLSESKFCCCIESLSLSSPSIESSRANCRALLSSRVELPLILEPLETLCSISYRRLAGIVDNVNKYLQLSSTVFNYLQLSSTVFSYLQLSSIIFNCLNTISLLLLIYLYII